MQVKSVTIKHPKTGCYHELTLENNFDFYSADEYDTNVSVIIINRNDIKTTDLLAITEFLLMLENISISTTVENSYDFIIPKKDFTITINN